MVRLLSILLASLPVVVTVAVVAIHAVNVPFMDQWELVPLLVKQRDGLLTLADLFRQHNEHRMVFPNLIMIGLASLTGWDVRAELAVGLALALAALGVALAMLRPLLAGAGTALRLWLPFAVSLLLFSLAQWENWLWGWQIQWFLSLLATLGTVLLLDRALAARNPWPALAGAAAAAGVAQFSIASGIMLWPAGLLMIALHPRLRRRPLAAAWATAAAAGCALFFAGWHRPPSHGSVPLEVVVDPGPLLAYAGRHLAGPLLRVSTGGAEKYGVAAVAVVGAAFAVVAGGLLATLLGAAAHLLVAGWRERAAALPWLGLAAFAGANTLVTALGRAGLGADHALISRYVTLGMLHVLAALALAVLAMRRMAGPAPRAAGRALAVALTALLLAAGWRSLDPLERHTDRLVAGRDCLLAIESATDECLADLHTDPALVRGRAAILRDAGWSSFAE